MRAKLVIIAHVLGEQTLEMPFVEHDHMIEQVASNTANDPFAVWILPGTPWRNLDLFEAHVLYTLLNMIAVDAVPVTKQIMWRCIPRKRFNELLGGPWRCGVFGEVDMDDAPAVMSQQDEHEQYAEGGGWHGKKIARHDIRNMVVEKGPPRW